MAFYDIFASLCEREGVKIADVAKELGIPQSTIKGWRNTHSPLDNTLKKIAKRFRVSKKYLSGDAWPEREFQNEIDRMRAANYRVKCVDVTNWEHPAELYPNTQPTVWFWDVGTQTARSGVLSFTYNNRKNELVASVLTQNIATTIPFNRLFPTEHALHRELQRTVDVLKQKYESEIETPQDIINELFDRYVDGGHFTPDARAFIEVVRDKMLRLFTRYYKVDFAGGDFIVIKANYEGMTVDEARKLLPRNQIKFGDVVNVEPIAREDIDGLHNIYVTERDVDNYPTFSRPN